MRHIWRKKCGKNRKSITALKSRAPFKATRPKTREKDCYIILSIMHCVNAWTQPPARSVQPWSFNLNNRIQIKQYCKKLANLQLVGVMYSTNSIQKFVLFSLLSLVFGLLIYCSRISPRYQVSLKEKQTQETSMRKVYLLNMQWERAPKDKIQIKYPN